MGNAIITAASTAAPDEGVKLLPVYAYHVFEVLQIKKLVARLILQQQENNQDKLFRWLCDFLVKLGSLQNALIEPGTEIVYLNAADRQLIEKLSKWVHANLTSKGVIL